MTHRLYYEDPYLTHFRTTMRRAEKVGDRWRVYLEESAFYPESGGQPADRGTLDGAVVLDVQEDGTGDYYHVVDRELTATEMSGEIDFERRFDHMQQHSGQHLLSAAAVRIGSWKTVSFHLGDGYATIDLETLEISPDQQRELEDLVNRVVWENRTVTTGFHDREEIRRIGLRKPTEREENIRVVQVDDFDASACGGTHVRRTGEVGLVKILKTEKIRGLTRVHFVCGGQALTAFRDEHDTLMAISSLTTTGVPELPRKVEKLLADLRRLERDCRRLGEELVEERVPGMLRQGHRVNDWSLVAMALEDSAQRVRHMAQKLVTPGNRAMAALVSVPDRVMFLGCDADSDADLTPLIEMLRSRFGLQGGGRKDFVQFGGLDPAQLDDILQVATTWLRGHLAGLNR